MPYKDPLDKRLYMREYMRRYRAAERPLPEPEDWESAVFPSWVPMK